MEIGNFFLAWATIPLILCMAGYLLVAVGIREFRLSSRIIYWFLFGMVLIAIINLLQLFLTDQFQYSYVASYSSSDLSNEWPHFYKLSALWAGQQGTFLLWLVFGLTLGFWVKSKARENEGWGMLFYILGQTFLLVLTIVSNPFEKMNFIPADGQGLNPLLQNYWMQIHPPIVFIGFAAACIPFAFAMAALATNRYDDWVRQTMPWVVFTVVTLGLGIFLGGYWAYETLGWGGYWAWDPVENASLIPWLVGIALVHGMVVEKSRGTWRRTNLFLAITLFLLIVYGTFLTRSGVLADFSVHSFVDLGYNNFLWASIVIIGIISYGLWAYRAYRMKVASAAGTEILSQEFATFLSMVLLLPFTLLVLFNGTDIRDHIRRHSRLQCPPGMENNRYQTLKKEINHTCRHRSSGGGDNHTTGISENSGVLVGWRNRRVNREGNSHGVSLFSISFRCRLRARNKPDICH
jgi:cytochrome c-type biogenesis protein CcmF